jgi:hypothetical protein
MASHPDEWLDSGQPSRHNDRKDWGDGWDYGVNWVWHQGAGCFGGYLKLIFGLLVWSIIIGGCLEIFG